MGEHDATWEPEDHLHNSKEMVQDYLASRTMPEGGGSNVMGLHVAQSGVSLGEVAQSGGVLGNVSVS